MKPLYRQRVLWPTLIVGLATVLIALGALQYRWSNGVSDAYTARMRAVLSSSMLDFRQDFVRELSVLTAGFPNLEDVATSDPKYLAAFSQWERSNAHAGMVKAIYVTERTSDTPPRLRRLNPVTSALEESPWPPKFDGLRETIGQTFLVRFSAHEPRPPMRMRHEPAHVHGYVKFGGPEGPGENRDHHGPPWFLDSSIPALIHPLGMRLPELGVRIPEREREGTLRGVIVELNQDYFAKQLFPVLARRYFPSSDALGYDVTVTTGGARPENLYSSNTRLSAADADARLDLLPPAGPQRSVTSNLPRFRTGADLPVEITRSGVFTFGAPFVLMGRGSPESTSWQLLVKNRQGSLEAVVGSLRRRNLALSFGILLVLAATMAMLIRASRGALRLAQLQMDFVAGVSHELRTPVTVISSAAENIADGLVQDKEQLARYGNAIRTQAAQLRQLIEQILLFASTRRNNSRYDLRPASVESVIDAALENTSELVRTAGFRVETSIQPGLPPVLVNMQALSQCLQNLITNAVKYGGEAGWIGVGAAVRQAARGTEVLITVADRGMGIAPDEMQQIFDPFYRGAEARAAQIHGSGLGLPLAKSMIEAMGGTITVESRPGAGSSFSIHLPASEAAVSEASVATQRAVNPRASYSKS